jgi:hypothetical protein
MADLHVAVRRNRALRHSSRPEDTLGRDPNAPSERGPSGSLVPPPALLPGLRPVQLGSRQRRAGPRVARRVSSRGYEPHGPPAETAGHLLAGLAARLGVPATRAVAGLHGRQGATATAAGTLHVGSVAPGTDAEGRAWLEAHLAEGVRAKKCPASISEREADPKDQRVAPGRRASARSRLQVPPDRHRVTVLALGRPDAPTLVAGWSPGNRPRSDWRLTFLNRFRPMRSDALQDHGEAPSGLCLSLSVLQA